VLLRSSLPALQREYNPKGGIIITENGCAVAEEDVDEAVKDIERAVYLKRYLTEVRQLKAAQGSSRQLVLSPL
jgi:beta-glucosidase